MKRFHFFEFEDYSWFPKIIRDGETDFLGFILKHLKYYKPTIALLETALVKSNHKHIVDLCSGNGSPIDFFKENTSLELTYTLTDKFPNTEAYKRLNKGSEGIISYQLDSLDVLNNTAELKGFHTMFTALHHFKPNEIKTIVKPFINRKIPIGFFDGGNKNILSILALLITHPILFFLGTPFIKPFKFSRLLFTYIIPLIPMFAIWDGTVSILRLHEPEDLLKLVNEADIEKTFDWQTGKKKNWLGFSVTYLIGLPKQV